MNRPIVLLLAGGDSTRFWPISDKMTVKFLGRPALSHAVEKLSRHGFGDIIIVASAANMAKFRSELESFPDVSLQYVEQTDPRGMAGAVKSADAHIRNRPVLVVNPADIYEDSLYEQLGRCLNDPKEHILCGTTMSSYFPGGYLQIADGYVQRILEKPDERNLPSNTVALVCDYFAGADNLLKAIDSVSTSQDDLFEQAIQSMINKKERFRFLHYDGFWGYLKYPWHIPRVSAYYLSTVRSGQGAGVRIHPTAALEGAVVLEEGVRVMEYAKIIGPTYIGKKTIVGSGTLVRESMIGQQCVVGFGTEITRSYVGDNCWFHKNYIGDSVLSDTVCFGAGAVTANFRFDGGNIRSRSAEQRLDTGITKLGAMIGSHVHVGVNASIMPGVKIGSNSIVGSGVTLDSDLPDGSYAALVKSSYSVQKNKIQHKEQDQEEIRKKLSF